MIIIVIVLSLVIALLSLTAHFRNNAIRFFGIIWMMIGLSCINPLIEEYVITHAQKVLYPANWGYILKFIGSLCSSVSNNFAPYFFLLFGLYYSVHSEEKGVLNNKKNIALLALVLPVSSCVIVFSRNLAYLSDNLNYIIISIWAVPYLLAGCFLLIRTYQKYMGKREKEQAQMVCYLSIPAVLMGMITTYILRSFGIDNAWVLNRWFALGVFLFYIYLISRYGLLGVKLRIEKMRLDNTMKVVISGASILNHTIKNEVIKILLSANNVINSNDRYSNYAEEDLQVILNSARHLEAMAHRIKENMQEVELKENSHNLARIIENALGLLNPYLLRKKIEIIKDYSIQTVLNCDELHLKEVLINLLHNAIEAIVSEGTIVIKVEQTKRHTLISIQDNGEGIPQELLPYIMDPFFSTKEKNVNYGLGLSYCYNVIRKHGGTIEIDSKPSAGTTVWLKFPAREISRRPPRKPLFSN